MSVSPTSRATITYISRQQSLYGHFGQGYTLRAVERPGQRLQFPSGPHSARDKGATRDNRTRNNRPDFRIQFRQSRRVFFQRNSPNQQGSA